MRYLYLLSIIFLFLHCKSDSSDSYDLNANELGWEINTEIFKPAKVQGSLIRYPNNNRLSITAMDGTEGILILINTPNKNLKGTYPLDKASNNSIKLNNVENKLLNVFTSESCKAAAGSVIITEHDESSKTVSGYFDVKLCSATYNSTKKQVIIENGKFNKASYFESIKDK